VDAGQPILVRFSEDPLTLTLTITFGIADLQNSWLVLVASCVATIHYTAGSGYQLLCACSNVSLKHANLLLPFGCVQHITEPTPIANHVFDLVITTAVMWIRRPVGRCYNLLVMHQFTSLCMWKNQLLMLRTFHAGLGVVCREML